MHCSYKIKNENKSNAHLERNFIAIQRNEIHLHVQTLKMSKIYSRGGSSLQIMPKYYILT